MTTPTKNRDIQSDEKLDNIYVALDEELRAVLPDTNPNPNPIYIQQNFSNNSPPVVASSNSFPSVQLGASDIDAIVKALLPPLADVLSQLTPEQQYVGLFTRVSKLALGKTFASDDELSSLVQDISKLVVEQVATNQIVNPDSCTIECDCGCNPDGSCIPCPDSPAPTNPDLTSCVCTIECDCGCTPDGCCAPCPDSPAPTL